MVYVTLIGSAVFAIIWVSFFLWRKKLRRKILISSMFTAPLSLTNFVFVPEYWDPQYDYLSVLRVVGLGDILFCFFIGGAFTSIYQVVFNKGPFETKNICPGWVFIPPALFVVFLIVDPKVNVMHGVVGCLLIGSLPSLFLMGWKTTRKILLSGLMSVLVYALIFLILWHIFPELAGSYNMDALSGFTFLQTPIEEYLWIFSYAIFATPIYDIFFQLC